jgi:hypothetical protein
MDAGERAEQREDAKDENPRVRAGLTRLQL